jgi:hypothetical protein
MQRIIDKTSDWLILLRRLKFGFPQLTTCIDQSAEIFTIEQFRRRSGTPSFRAEPDLLYLAGNVLFSANLASTLEVVCHCGASYS